MKNQEVFLLGQKTLTERKDKIYRSNETHFASCNDLRDPSTVDYSAPISDWLRSWIADGLTKWECI